MPRIIAKVNTPAHALINLAVLAGPRRAGAGARNVLAILIGGLLPDLPMLVFYAAEKLRGTPEAVIWSERYFAPEWQAFFDAPNALPLILAALAVAVWRRWTWTAWLLASMALHAGMDLLVHHDDGHRHFWPLSDFRFASPVSYWDPAHYGTWVLSAEILVCMATLIWAWRRFPARGHRAALGALGTVYAGYLAFAAIVWGPMAA